MSSSHESYWERVKLRLQGKMTKNTFDRWLRQTKAISATNGHYQILVQNEMAQAWLQHRLHHLIKSTLINVDPEAETLEFIAQMPTTRDQPEPTTRDQPEPTSELGPALVLPTEHPDLSTVDYAQLWIDSGFLQVPHYAATFWRLHLGDKAFSLWTLLQARPIQKSDRVNGWTPIERYYYRELARKMSCSPNSIRGGLEDCYELRQSIKYGQPFAECCGRYAEHRWCDNGKCHHWRTGLLEILFQEQLVAIEERKSVHSRAHILKIQVWRHLPLLTPHQVNQLSDADQDKHGRWIERYGHLAQPVITAEAWERESRHSLVPSLDDGSRLLFDDFRPNPLIHMDQRE